MTFFFSGEGHAPAVRDLVVVQDGLGARLDLKLARPRSLRVGLGGRSKAPVRLVLILHGWWHSVVEASQSGGAGAGRIPRPGPFRRGLIAEAGPGADSPWEVVGDYDLERSGEVTMGDPRGPVDPEGRAILPEMTGLEP